MQHGTELLDGVGPMPVCRPGSVSEVGELIRQARGDAKALFPTGGGSHLSIGNPPTRAGTVVNLSALDRVVEFAARDMTVTVQAGITIARLRDLLAPENLRLPIDVALPERASLGGIIAANISGSRRYGFGTLRDYVIGISALNDEGQEFKAGGRVVKNVAGYDLCKLLTGSLGTLGIITQATLKLRPLAEASALVRIDCASGQLEPLLTMLHGSRTRPIAIDALNAVAGSQLPCKSATPWMVMVGFEGNAEAVRWQVDQLQQEASAYSTATFQGAEAASIWHGLAHFGVCSSDGQTDVLFKGNLRPGSLAGFCVAADRDGAMLHALAGNGIVFGHWSGGMDLERAKSTLAAWRQQAASAQGAVVVHRCPSSWKSSLDVWGPPPASAWLMREVKKQFDPHGLFNPGRFVDGI